MTEKYKSNLISLLESISLDEKAMEVSDVGNLALWIDKGVVTEFVLYDPSKLIKYLTKNDIDSIQYGEGGLEKIVLGYIKIGRNFPANGAHGAKNVDIAAAKNKYGPLMYDIAMSLAGGLTPDRGKPSKQAQKVWKYYFDNRDDVKKKPLDNVEEPKTKTKKDDAYIIYPETEKNFLNYAYFATNKVDTRVLINNSKKAIQQAAEVFSKKWADYGTSALSVSVARNKVLALLDQAGSEFFGLMYGN